MSTVARPKTAAKAMHPPAFQGPLDWRTVVEWLAMDNVITGEEAQRTIARCSQAESAQQPLVRLAAVAIARASDGKSLDIEMLTQYIAGKAGLAYLRIDPLKVDVGKVADSMSAAYAERHHVLPVQVTSSEVVVATAEPFLVDWVSEVERQSRRSVRRVVANPQDIHRFTAEFFALAKSVRNAQKAGGANSGATFEQLVELGNKIRPARQRHPPGAPARAGRDPLSHRRCAASGLPDAHGRAQRHDRAHQAAGSHGRG